MVDALARYSDEGRGQSAISFGEVIINLRPGDLRMGKPLFYKEETLLHKKVKGAPRELKHLST